MNSDWEQPAANFRFTTTAKFLAHEAYSSSNAAAFKKKKKQEEEKCIF